MIPSNHQGNVQQLPLSYHLDTDTSQISIVHCLKSSLLQTGFWTRLRIQYQMQQLMQCRQLWGDQGSNTRPKLLNIAGKDNLPAVTVTVHKGPSTQKPCRAVEDTRLCSGQAFGSVLLQFVRVRGRIVTCPPWSEGRLATMPNAKWNLALIIDRKDAAWMNIVPYWQYHQWPPLHAL